jgi:hypothetical protein
MNLKTLALPILFIAFGFIGFGDRILPKPLSSISLNTRTSINPDGATEKAVNSISH